MRLVPRNGLSSLVPKVRLGHAASGSVQHADAPRRCAGAIQCEDGDVKTIKDLKEWLAQLPPEFDQCDISSVVGCFPCTAKRVVAWRYKNADEQERLHGRQPCG